MIAVAEKEEGELRPLAGYGEVLLLSGGSCEGALAARVTGWPA